ncbi:hypothetical protein BGV52_09990 [Burkholderia ubonensis]|uniref:LLM class flavin-dependent oxidoreductase n=2 Tax=Burkholderia ubonensis TaxID=101571 RepID=UPI00091049FA|nr:LLM class flavin-dependent oxidoreductase [Burkholderia ubonensis]OJA52031.1 hypothetical protein BGV68_21810 [Burkholderia ubonensis]OJB10542.1 hypothetical protein BGV52_09990 [Burkholderia ubonensis]OJB55659.1 hypothetical protein BGV61_22300 [Burkholderia ubonensis]
MMRQATEPRRPFMLPFHHPAELAHRICMPDHISQGRLMVGIGASGANLELEMRDIDYKPGAHREMTACSMSTTDES